MHPFDTASPSPSEYYKSTLAILKNLHSTASNTLSYRTSSPVVTPSLVQLLSIDSSAFYLSSSLDSRNSDVSSRYPSPHNLSSMIPGSQNTLMTATSNNSYFVTQTVTQNTYPEETVPKDVNNESTLLIVIAVAMIIIILSLLITAIGICWNRIKIVTVRSNVTAHNVGKTVFALVTYT